MFTPAKGNTARMTDRGFRTAFPKRAAHGVGSSLHAKGATDDKICQVLAAGVPARGPTWQRKAHVLRFDQALSKSQHARFKVCRLWRCTSRGFSCSAGDGKASPQRLRRQCTKTTARASRAKGFPRRTVGAGPAGRVSENNHGFGT